jgi:AcrR family transcriptional regulator
MSPRRYDLGRRRHLIDENRRRVIDAARALLAESTTYTAFTVDAVAKRADVARATVYYQFGSKPGVLEALCDSLAEAGQMTELAGVFTEPDPREALRGFIAAFARFWASDRLVMRRLRALAALDPDVATVIEARDERNRTGLQILVDRIAKQSNATSPIDAATVVQVVHTLTSFETFDSLAGPTQEPTDVVPLVVELAEAALGRKPPAAPARAARGRRVDKRT